MRCDRHVDDLTALIKRSVHIATGLGPSSWSRPQTNDHFPGGDALDVYFGWERVVCGARCAFDEYEGDD